MKQLSKTRNKHITWNEKTAFSICYPTRENEWRRHWERESDRGWVRETKTERERECRSINSDLSHYFSSHLRRHWERESERGWVRETKKERERVCRSINSDLSHYFSSHLSTLHCTTQLILKEICTSVTPLQLQLDWTPHQVIWSCTLMVICQYCTHFWKWRSYRKSLNTTHTHTHTHMKQQETKPDKTKTQTWILSTNSHCAVNSPELRI